MAVLTITPIAAARGADYLINSVGRQDGVAVIDERGVAAYFDAAVRHGEPAGIWFGRQAEADGLAGQEVTREQLGRLFRRGEHPSTGHQLGRRPAKYKSVEERVLALRERVAECGWSDERLHREEVAIRARGEQVARTGYDLTFTAPKSASVLFAIAPNEVDRKLVMNAHESAVIETVNMADRMLLTRTGTDGIRQVETQGIFAAGFTHRTSRADDPHLHTHVAIAAKVKTPDERWRALDGSQLFNVSAVLRNHYELAFMANLSRDLGVCWVRREKTGVMEIQGATEELLVGFSKRSPAIEAYMAERAGTARSRFGLDHYRAWAATRGHKSKGRTTATLGARWRREAHRYQPRAWEAMTRADHELSLGISFDTWERLVEAAGRVGTIVALDQLGVDLPERADSARIAEALVAAVPAWRLEATTAILESERATWTPAQVASAAKRVFEAHPQLVRTQGGRSILVDVEAELAATTAEVLAKSRRLTPEEPTGGLGPVRSDGRSVYERTESVRYTSPRLLAREGALLQLAETPGAITFTRRQLQAGFTELRQSRPGGTELSEAQRAAIGRVLTQEARVRVLVGPAGAGKTTTMAGIAAAYRARGLECVGIATSQVAARTLGEETGMITANAAAFLHPKSPAGELVRRALRPGSLLVVDEASMAGTFQLAAAADKAIKAGADVLLIGDPAQLGAVEAGGVFAELCRRHEVVELEEVQRFCDPVTGEIRAWEAEASMALRRGEVVDALAAYEAHGRIVGGTEEDLRSHLVDELVQSRLPGQKRQVLVVVGTEAEAAELSSQVRQRLVEHGAVDDRCTVRLADDNVAGRGDLIQTRANQNRIQVANRDVWAVEQVNPNGSIWVIHEGDGRRRLLGPDYVGHEVQLSYALTAHAAQGVTAEVAHALVRSETSHAALYVAASRGRECNTIWVVTDSDGYTAPADRDLIAVLGELIERADLNQAAASTVEALYEAACGSLAHLGAVLEDLRAPTADRTDVAAVVATVDPESAERLGQDPGLARLARYLDQLSAKGWDTEQALRSVAAERSFYGAESVADVLEWRLEAAFGERGRLDEELGKPRPLVAGSAREWIDHVYGPPGADTAVDAVRHAVAERLATVLRQASEEPAPWVAEIRASSKTSRLDAIASVAAYRDLSGYQGADPIGPPPPLYAQAERAAWRVARDTMAVAEVELPPGDFRVLHGARQLHRFLVETPSGPERQAATQTVVANNVERAGAADAVNQRAIRAEAFARALDRMGPERQRVAQEVLSPSLWRSHDHDYGRERGVDRGHDIER